MKLSNRVYDILKWVVIIVIPAAATAYVSLAAVWGWPFADEISKTAAAVCMFLGAILGISSVNYNKDNKPPAENE
ncbi:MAG: phage holin [Clostridia bacterium]|nr:phage holin [Clostridia bacterium]